MEPKIKTVNVQYVIKINDELSDVKPSLREARAKIKIMPVSDYIQTVSIVKTTTTEQILDIYEPKQVVVLTANQLDEGLGD